MAEDKSQTPRQEAKGKLPKWWQRNFKVMGNTLYVRTPAETGKTTDGEWVWVAIPGGADMLLDIEAALATAQGECDGDGNQ